MFGRRYFGASYFGPRYFGSGIGRLADLSWPFLLFVPRTPEVTLAGITVSGGRSLTGKLQEVAADSGYWRITLGNIPIRTREQVLQWRELEGLCEGRLNTVLVPVYDSKRSPWPSGVPGATITATTSGDILRGATSGNIELIVGADLQPGMFFSAGERLYRIKTVSLSSGDDWAVTFLPPARETIADGTALEFARPVCRCRLASDDGMSLPLDLQRFATKSVDFEEDI